MNASLRALCTLVVALTFGCSKPTQADSSTPLTPYDNLRQQVVDRVQKGMITPDPNGVATLPDDLKDASPDSRVITAHDPALGLLVAFNLSLNRSGRSEYLVYSENEIPAQTKTIKLGSLQLNVGSKSRAHWYQAIRSGA